MSELTLFGAFENYEIRWNAQPDDPWWVARDVCEALEIQWRSDALDPLEADERGYAKTASLGGDQKMIVVNEAGLYRLIFRSRTRKAKTFQRWVFHEIIPSIRQTGSYTKFDRELRLKELDVQIETLKLEQLKVLHSPKSQLSHLNDGQKAVKQSLSVVKTKRPRKPHPPGKETTARFMAILSTEVEKTTNEIAREVGTCEAYARRTLIGLHRKNLVTRRRAIEHSPSKYFYLRVSERQP
jgi:prophage antirepressor-like protein